MKKKLLIVILFCLATNGVVWADEVINIDLNDYNDNTAYTGTAVVNDGVNQWNVYYGGWGKAMGSPRSADLAAYNEPCTPSTYAAQVWIGDPGVDHNYVSGTALMDDGFINNPNITGDPNIVLFGQGAYGGTFDIYVYGSEAGSFTLKRGSTVIGTETVTGGVASGFVEGGNYVVFENVNIASDPNVVRIVYTNVINGLQLVKQKDPVAITSSGVTIGARDYDVSYDTNRRSGESGAQLFGPDMSVADDYSAYGWINYLAAREYMEYDVTMDDADEGEYSIYILVDASSVDAENMQIYFNDMLLGTVEAAYTGELGLAATNSVTVNIFGSTDVQQLKWKMGAASYHNIAAIRLDRVGELNMPDCASVYTYGFGLTGDLNEDCKVNFKDLDVLSESWLSCIDPNENNCP